MPSNSQSRNPAALPINLQEIARYVEQEDDFAFELEVLRQIEVLSIPVEHGGTYVDSVTGKVRQFDFRIEVHTPEVVVFVAIEAKCVSEFGPLLISRTPRRADEAFHEVLGGHCGRAVTVQSREGRTQIGDHPQRMRKRGGNTLYRDGLPVGRKVTALKRVGAALEGTDKEIFERYSQAISSSHGLVRRAVGDLVSNRYHTPVVVLPVAVIKDRALWAVDFISSTETRVPTLIDEAHYFIGHDIQENIDSTFPSRLTISHLHFATITGLRNLLTRIRTDEQFRRQLAG